ncbi:MAG TPA: isocitrate lyase/phosphoenolpyruvate mutase family protein [Cellulomonas sp.]|nr:isocitrate lyase/phosphoenolpyruvate mutase family protein [Cellulomonas sp.]HYQ74365.1 isocitrate lyase/phosphoenolpyruvate mutase family protein [Cellulomonas sp.]
MTFAALHDGPAPLLLPNAWDVGSALAFAEAGFPAVGTTSLGVAASRGAPDASGATREATLRLVQALHALPVHVSADAEDGYADDPAEAAAAVAELAEAGAAGVNVEDSAAGALTDPARAAAKVAAIRAAAPGLFVNARVDTYWLREDATVGATVARALAYADAGADGIFVPGATDPADIAALTAAIDLPVNVLLVPGLTLARLGELGVRRVSTGSLPYRAAVDAAVGSATAVRDGGTPPAATSYWAVQERLQAFAVRAAGVGG